MKEKLIPDNRGVSEVVGAILVFGVLIALLAILQTQAIPASNQQVEFDHSVEVQGDMVDFHKTASEVRTSGDLKSTSVQMGTGYPERLLFFNPQRPGGTLSTSEARQAEISGIKALDDDVDDYITESATGTLTFDDTRTFSYRADYNFLEGAPTIRYEYGILYNDFDDAATIQNPGSVIDDDEINLVFMAGDYSESRTTRQSLDVRPNSAPARPVDITNVTGQDVIEIELPTELDVDVWEEEYGDQEHVEIRDHAADNRIVIELDGDKKYTLRMSKLALESGVEKPEAHYIVPADDGTTTIGAGDNATVKYEVRDRFNNPVSGAEVEVDGESDETDSDGRVTFEVEPDQPRFYTGELVDCTGGDRCEADFRVQLSDLNPNPSSGVRMTDASTFDLGILETGLIDIGIADTGFEFNLTSDDGDVAMTRFRINHYHTGQHSEASLITEANDATVEDIKVGGGFVTDEDGLDELLPASESGTEYVLEFDEDVEEEHYAVVTIVYEDGQRALYFISDS